MLTITEYSKLHKMTARQVRHRISTGKIHAVKRGKTWEIIEDGLEKHSAPKQPPPPPEPVDDEGLTLKEQKLKIEIKRIEQQLAEKRRDIEEKFKIDLMEKIFNVLKPLPEAFRKCKLSKKQAETIQTALKESLTALKKL